MKKKNLIDPECKKIFIKKLGKKKTEEFNNQIHKFVDGQRHMLNAISEFLFKSNDTGRNNDFNASNKEYN